MSRSRRKTPIGGMVSLASERGDKQKANRKLRRIVGEIIKKTGDRADLTVRNVSNIWSFNKDGKCWWPPRAGTAAELNKFMRK